jgi:hypothetical protein
MCSVRIPITSLKAISKLDSFLMLQPVWATTNGGSVTTEGDMALFANRARTKFSVNGSGILMSTFCPFSCCGIFGRFSASATSNSYLVVRNNPLQITIEKMKALK